MFGKPTEKNCSTRFNNLKLTDNGSYFFRIEDSSGLKYSYKKPIFSQVEIVVRASPPNPTVLLFQDQQEVMEVMEGKSVTLSCFKIFCPSFPSSLTWSSSPEHLINANITEQKNQTHHYSDLMFTVTQHHHRAEFTCTATHYLQEQNTTHSTRQLHVQYAPKSVSAHVSPAGVIVEGHSVTLSCSSEANPAVNYSWYRHTEGDLKPVQTGPNLTEPNLTISITNLIKTNLTETNMAISNTNLTGPNLTIRNINRSHSGRYYCKAENQHGTQNTSVLLDVQYPPEKTYIHINSVAMEGHSVILSCSSEAKPAVKYSWYRHTEGDLKPNLIINNTNLTEANQINSNTSLTEPNLTLSYFNLTGPNLIISNVNLAHSGRYYCRAENQHGTQNTSVLLDVQYAPKSVSAHVSPAGVIMEGHSVTLSCSSEANPAVNYSWYRHNKGDLKPVQTEPNLMIKNTNRSHSGQYYCRAENQHGTQNTSVLLDVHFPPKISSFCSRDDTLRCVCKVDGNPLPKLQWRLSGKALNSTEEMKISEQTVGNKSLESTLSIRQSLSDSSVLQCWSANAHGSASHQFQHITTQHTGLHTGCVLLGFAIGASLILIFCVLTVCNQRKKYRKLAESTRDDSSGLILTQRAVTSNGQCVCADKSLLLPTSATLHYSSIDFTNMEPPSGEIRGLSTLTEEYATVRLHPANAHTTPDSTNTPEKNTPSEDTRNAKKNTPSEEVIYENMKLY
ncbi:sialic acid-binding Ig-like lectin 11 [Danio aesculapii]|uniref:sialic acid-binding Ig-like lectin 11 n=1 Tax=Danio aesculapii TaxID=1142201 RepID=UPI0024C02751|nr:sialic acid-binding Ig-like lectin 11 [Danio aesculapii]